MEYYLDGSAVPLVFVRGNTGEYYPFTQASEANRGGRGGCVSGGRIFSPHAISRPEMMDFKREKPTGYSVQCPRNIYELCQIPELKVLQKSYSEMEIKKYNEFLFELEKKLELSKVKQEFHQTQLYNEQQVEQSLRRKYNEVEKKKRELIEKIALNAKRERMLERTRSSQNDLRPVGHEKMERPTEEKKMEKVCAGAKQSPQRGDNSPRVVQEFEGRQKRLSDDEEDSEDEGDSGYDTPLGRLLNRLMWQHEQRQKLERRDEVKQKALDAFLKSFLGQELLPKAKDDMDKMITEESGKKKEHVENSQGNPKNESTNKVEEEAIEPSSTAQSQMDVDVNVDEKKPEETISSGDAHSLQDSAQTQTYYVTPDYYNNVMKVVADRLKQMDEEKKPVDSIPTSENVADTNKREESKTIVENMVVEPSEEVADTKVFESSPNEKGSSARYSQDFGTVADILSAKERAQRQVHEFEKIKHKSRRRHKKRGKGVHEDGVRTDSADIGGKGTTKNDSTAETEKNEKLHPLESEPSRSEPNEQQKNDSLDMGDIEVQQADEVSKSISASLEKIENVSKKVNLLRRNYEQSAFSNPLEFSMNPQGEVVISFSKNTKSFKYYSEALLRHLEELDSIRSYGNETVRLNRKRVVSEINRLLDGLDSYLESQRADYLADTSSVSSALSD